MPYPNDFAACMDHDACAVSERCHRGLAGRERDPEPQNDSSKWTTWLGGHPEKGEACEWRSGLGVRT